MSRYDREFYKNLESGSRKSAQKIIPYITKLLEPYTINSVIDFGCGVGTWLAEFKEFNSDVVIRGMDFGEADKDQIQIPENSFERVDLSKKISLERKYDLAISVEVAEHLHEKCSDTFVDNLCNASDVVLFSAAVPGQGGVEHLNEQPLHYWIEKFKDRGFNCYDIIRPHFWNDKDVEVWYRQNAFLYVKESKDVSNCKLNNFDEKIPILDIVHPDLLNEVASLLSNVNVKLININYLRIYHPNLYRALRKIRGK